MSDNGADAFRRVVRALEQAGIPFMLTGSFASSFHGVPRATQDIDFVIAPGEAPLRRFVSDLVSDGFYVDSDAAVQAMHDEAMFNAIDQGTAWKIDFIICKSRPFSQEEFGRRSRVIFEGLSLWIATVEDVLIAKLEWASKGQSRRQIDDCAQLLRIRRAELDRAYLSRWVKTLGLDEQWEAALGASRNS